jgi:FtsP/CotA-like multicopper oxidase with cupredoxin domain
MYHFQSITVNMPHMPLYAVLPALQRRAPEWEHLGVMGPVIRATVGDTIKVVFKNLLEDNAVSMHPHGVFYDKGSEGSPYYDGLPGKASGQAPFTC